MKQNEPKKTTDNQINSANQSMAEETVAE